MTYDELMEIILNSSFENWVYDDEKGIFTFREDLDIRIEERRSSSDRDEFNEEWATRHPDPHATRVFYDIYYRSSFVKSFMLVSVDGGRAHLPLPESAVSTTIPYERYALARAVDYLGTLDEYIERFRLTVANQ